MDVCTLVVSGTIILHGCFVTPSCPKDSAQACPPMTVVACPPSPRTYYSCVRPDGTRYDTPDKIDRDRR